MASFKRSNQFDVELPMEIDPPVALNSTNSTNANQKSAAGFGGLTYNNTQSCRVSMPWGQTVNPSVVRQALDIGLPHHLLVRSIRHRLQTKGTNYGSINQLVADIFNPSLYPLVHDPEIPMQTDHLEEALKKTPAQFVHRRRRQGYKQ